MFYYICNEWNFQVDLFAQRRVAAGEANPETKAPIAKETKKRADSKPSDPSFVRWLFGTPGLHG